WPHPLCVDYDWDLPQTAAAVVGPALALGALALLTLWALVRRPALGFLGAWFFLTLAPTSSIMPINDLAAERRMYLPLTALAVLAAVAGDEIGPALPSRPRWAGPRRRR